MRLAFDNGDFGIWNYINKYKLQLDPDFVKDVISLKENMFKDNHPSFMNHNRVNKDFINTGELPHK